MSFACLLAAPAFGADEAAPPPPKLKITGYGLLGNLQLKRTVKLLEFEKEPPAFFDADFIENTCLILASRLQADGHLDPAITVRIDLEDGTRTNLAWNASAPESLPRPLRARAARFRIEPGVRGHYRRILFTGLSELDDDQARSFFMETGGLIPLKRDRVYTPDRLNRSVAGLRSALNRLGYRDARVTVGRLERDVSTGAVTAEIQVVQGPRFRVRSVREEIFLENAPVPAETRTNVVEGVYSRLWAQDYSLGIKTNYYHLGYPETSVDFRTIHSEPAGEEEFLDLEAVVRTGSPVRVGGVEFHGAKHAKVSSLRKRVPLKPGEPLDRLRAEQGRYRLSRLGGFDQVELDYEPVTTNVWDVNYTLKEGKRADISLLLGFGSYDLVRGGVEVNHYDLWGLAHHSRLRLVQSFKSSSGDYTYTIPEMLGEDIDVFLNGSGLRREEVSFVRLEYGGGGGVHRRFPQADTDAVLRYNYGILEATDTGADFAPPGAEDPVVGEIILDVSHDRRDNPLSPQRGYRLSANLEVASPSLGGEVGFQRLELGASCHLRLNSSEWIHLGIRHGAAATIGRPDDDLPFTRRFFPGGENSVRGYKEGEAAPRDVDGNIIGAETYLSGSIEFEQALTPKWSLVGFLDAVAFAGDLGDYPGNESLYSAGGGVRWKTIIGPLRVEYGRNLNPRPRDPAGTVQFSLGAPF